MGLLLGACSGSSSVQTAGLGGNAGGGGGPRSGATGGSRGSGGAAADGSSSSSGPNDGGALDASSAGGAAGAGGAHGTGGTTGSSGQGGAGSSATTGSSGQGGAGGSSTGASSGLGETGGSTGSGSGGHSGTGGEAGGDSGDAGGGLSWPLDSGTLGGWTCGFADYASALESNFQLSCAPEDLPAEVGPGGGVRIQGYNQSDDLFSYLAHPVRGLTPSALYRLDMTVVIDSNAASDCGGVGGSPGKSVYVKLGASSVEPAATVASDGYLRMNIDKGNQSTGGADMEVVGDIGNTLTCADSTYQAKTLTLSDFSARSSSDGALWLLFGTDSGFEGKTTYYVDEVSATLTAQ